jgi:CHAT domain-containing protein
MLAAIRADALVYLVPPERRDGERAAGHAILIRPVTGVIEVLELPGLVGTGQTPLDAYRAALDHALASLDQEAMNPEGFRTGSAGRRWADALVRLGSWTYDQVMGPLIEHVRGWNLGRRPNLTLIPLGELATIPYAAAWTGQVGPEGPASRRRYAIEDVVLSYAASARLLGEISRRPRQGLNDRVVIAADPTAEFVMSRRTARLLAGNIYPSAEVYGRKEARNGPATVEALLGALPAVDRPGASLLHLTTHGTTDPEPQLQTSDGWLALNRILDQARGRAPDAPGGLVITSACLTDSTRAHYDESLTLATAFLAAGACSVIGTRWPVDDDTAAALSIRLHYHLQRGLPSAEALRQAQLDLIRPTDEIRKSFSRFLEESLNPDRLSHPASWAGYVHHGSDNRRTS